MRSLAILEPGIDHRTGHAHAFASSLTECAGARGIAYRIYGSERVPGEFARRHGIVPLFRHLDVPDPHRDLVSGPLYRLMTQRRMMAGDLAGPAGPQVHAEAVLVLPTAYPWLQLAVADWLRTVPPAQRPRVVVSYHEAGALFASDKPELTLEAATLRLCAHSLLEVVPRERLLITATMAALARRIAGVVNLPVALAPVANPVERYRSDIPADARRDDEGRPHVAIIGIPRTDKAPLRNLLPIAAAIARRLPQARLFVQVWGSFDPAADLPAAETAADMELHPGALSDEAYRDTLLRSAVVVLPYEGGGYRARVSGIFVDAASAGCLAAVPAGTWMARTIAIGLASGTVFADNRPETIADAVDRAVAALPGDGRRALEQSARWPRMVGVGPYLDAIERALGKIGGGAPAAIASAPPLERRRRWVLLDPRSRRSDDDRALMVTQLSSLAEGRSSSLSAYGRAGPEAEMVAGVTPLFRPLRAPSWAVDRRAAPLARFVMLSRQWGDDLTGPDGPQVGPGDLLLVPDTEPAMLCALARWLGGMPSDRRPGLVIHFQRGPDLGSQEPPSLPQSTTAYALRMLTDTLPAARISATATSTPVARSIAAVGGLDCRVSPAPHPIDGLAASLPPSARRSRSGAPRIAVLDTGVARPGTSVAAVAAAIRERVPEASMIVQDEAAPNGPLVRSVSPALGAMLRQEIVGSAAVAILAGAERPGRMTIAFVEAAAAGTVVVVPPGGEMAAEVASGSAVGAVARDGGPVAMAEATVAALKQDGEGARAAAPLWHRRYGMRAWLDAATAAFGDGDLR